MAEHAHSVRVDACTTRNRTSSHWQDIVLALFSPLLVLIALAGMVRTETLAGHPTAAGLLHRTDAKVAHAPLLLAEGSR